MAHDSNVCGEDESYRPALISVNGVRLGLPDAYAGLLEAITALTRSGSLLAGRPPSSSTISHFSSAPSRFPNTRGAPASNPSKTKASKTAGAPVPTVVANMIARPSDRN
jgi:hypothetical protein